MRKIRKVLAIILTIIMCVSLCVLSVRADETTPDMNEEEYAEEDVTSEEESEEFSEENNSEEGGEEDTSIESEEELTSEQESEEELSSEEEALFPKDGLIIEDNIFATSHSQAEAVAWIAARRAERWCQDYDGIAGKQCVDLIKYYSAYLGVNLGRGDAYTYAYKSDLLASIGWSYQSTPQPGDIVVFGSTHIGIISDIRNEKGIPYLIHNGGQPKREEDFLELYNVYEPISGHYRLKEN